MFDNVCRKVNAPVFPLASATEGEPVYITLIHGGCKLRERLLSMGINIDDKIIVLQRRGHGAVLIAKDNNRYMLGGGMAQKIQVSSGR